MTENSLPESLDSLSSALEAKTSECEAAQRKIMSLKRDLRRTDLAFDSAVETINKLEAKIEALEAHLNTPELENFAAGVVSEAQHQRARWGSEHDATKTGADWFWLIGYLAQKALYAELAGDKDKALHHCISTASVLANWHSALSGEHTKE